MRGNKSERWAQSQRKHLLKEKVMTQRTLARVIQSVATSDGAGVKLRRSIGSAPSIRLDPFLLLDEFGTDRPEDYIAGFPDHPHRGFETVTYMFAGLLRHKDSVGNEGVIEKGGVQWMTAGRGIVHSEMPEQDKGLMWGTQLWVNLPASEKMSAPAYREFSAHELPREQRNDGIGVIAIAGTTSQGTVGAVTGRPTEPVYFDVRIPEGSSFTEAVPSTHSGFIFVIEGSVGVMTDAEDGSTAFATTSNSVVTAARWENTQHGNTYFS